MLTNVLLAAILISNLLIFRDGVVSLFRSKKKIHFLRKRDNFLQNIWDKEAQKFLTQEMRESIRLDRDRESEKVDALETEIKRDHKEETLKALQVKLDQAKENVDRFTKQMVMLDNEITGVPYTPGDAENGVEANPGQQGLNDTIASLGEANRMYTKYTETL